MYLPPLTPPMGTRPPPPPPSRTPLPIVVNITDMLLMEEEMTHASLLWRCSFGDDDWRSGEETPSKNIHLALARRRVVVAVVIAAHSS